MKLSARKDINAFTDLNAGKYTVLFFRLIGGNYTIIDTKQIDIKEQKFIYKKKDFLNFNKNKFLFTDKKSNYFGFDFDSGEQIHFDKQKLPENITLEEIDRYVNQGLIKQLAHSLEKPKSDKSQWIWLIIGAIIGTMAGFIIGNVISNGGVVV